ncbi:MAG: hypothetical protein ACP5VP_11575 [Candidatus Limnocylindrales bacterium]
MLRSWEATTDPAGADSLPAGPDVAGEVAQVGLFQPAVELGQALGLQDRHEEVAPLAADLTLDAAHLFAACAVRPRYG